MGWAPPPPGSRPLSPGWGPPADNRGQPGERAQRPAGTSVPNYLGWAIVCTIFFFTLAGAVGIVFSIMANRRASSGDIDGAFRASRTAKTWCWVSLILGLVAYLLLATGALHVPTAKT